MKPVAQKPVPASSFDLKTGKVITLLFALIAFGPGLEASEWYASPNATTNGNGSITNAWPLQIALTNSAIQLGDTVWLRGGTYGVGTNIYMCRLIGTSNSSIIVRQYPGERAIIDGEITDAVPNQGTGSWTTFWGFEITSTTARTNSMTGRLGGLNLGGVGQKAINMVIHDTSEACIGDDASDGTGREIYGCILWGCGIYDTNSADGGGASITNPWTRGSPIYTQNRYNTMTVADNISSRNFTTGMKAYAENGYASGYIFDGNVVFGCPVAGIEVECLNNSITNATVINNFTYHCGKTPMGYFSSDTLAQHYGLVYSNNYIVDSPGGGSATLWLKRWQDVKVVRNTIVTVCPTNEWYAGSGVGSSMGGHFIELYPVTNTVLSYTINSNAYYGGVEQDGGWYNASGTNYGPFYHTYQPFTYKYPGDVSPEDGTNGLLSFAAWTSVWGFDLNSTYTTNLPTANVVVVRPNKYEVGRGHIVIFNWQSNSTVSVDISSLGLTNGQRFEVRDVQNYLGTPCITTNYNAAQPTISLPLTLTNMTVLTPVGDINPATFSSDPDVHTASLFNVFVVLPVVAGPAPPILLTGAAKLPNGAFQFAFTNTPVGTNYITTNITTTITTNWSKWGPPKITGYTTNTTTTLTTNGSANTATVLATTNLLLPLTNWTVLGTVTDNPPGQFQFTDPQATNHPLRFYRVRSP